MRKTCALLLGLFVAACSDPLVIDDSAPLTTFRLTDAPFPYDMVQRVDIYVVKVEASLAADTTAASGGAFRTVATVGRKIDLLALHGGLSDVLGGSQLAPGAIKAIRLIIDTDQSSITMKSGAVLTGSSSPGIAWQSSAGIATLNATVEGNIPVGEADTDVVIDFDVGRAFLDPADVTPPCGCSGFIFSPVVRAAAVSRTGSVSGSARLGSVTGPAAAEATVELKLGNPSSPSNTWGTISTTRTDANGDFKLAFVSESALYTKVQPSWSYMIVVTKASGQSGGKAVTVMAGADNQAGIIAVPQS